MSFALFVCTYTGLVFLPKLIWLRVVFCRKTEFPFFEIPIFWNCPPTLQTCLGLFGCLLKNKIESLCICAGSQVQISYTNLPMFLLWNTRKKTIAPDWGGWSRESPTPAIDQDFRFLHQKTFSDNIWALKCCCVVFLLSFICLIMLWKTLTHLLVFVYGHTYSKFVPKFSPSDQWGKFQMVARSQKSLFFQSWALSNRNVSFK